MLINYQQVWDKCKKFIGLELTCKSLNNHCVLGKYKVFLEMGHSQPLFLYFGLFHLTTIGR